MSIIIKSNQLNTIIYKYLLEAGLSHTAYVMFNEAKMQSSLQEFKYDIKSGHLLMLLEKALIFSQIQSHVNFGQYNQCLQPFYLLKLHTCKITQKVRKQKGDFMKQLNDNITQSIKRTNAIYNTQLSNKMYDQIVYEPRGANYFQKFHKLKFTDNDGETQLGNKSLQIDGQNPQSMAFYNKRQNVIYLTQNDSFQQLTISKVYPCILNGQIQNVELFKMTPTSLIMVFSGNRINLVLRQDTQKSIQFDVPLQESIKLIHYNPNFCNIVCLQSANQFFVVNLKNMQQIMSGGGMFRWRSFDQYVIFLDGTMQLRSLVKEQVLIQYRSQETSIDDIEVSANKTFFFTTSYKKSKISVYTFQKQEPIFVFNFAEEQQQLKKVIWIYRNQVDYLAILTDLALRVWEVQFNAYCLRIDIQKYQVGQILSLAALQKNHNQTFLLALGSQNLLVSDVSNQKIQRVQSPPNVSQMSNAGRNTVLITNNQSIYFLNGEKLSQLFK